jgi:2',3'-cyclic-nucleotide 2'-phosphodiesterase (5'-nucleotidase family)
VLLTILHTNDLHGRLEALPRLATLIQHERALARSQGRRVLLVDAGDSSARSSPESVATQGRANFVLLDAAGYQAVTLGNRDLKFGAAALQRLIASVSFPVLAANLLPPGDEARPLGPRAEGRGVAVPGLRSHATVESEGYRVGLVGLTAWLGYDFTRYGYRAVNGLQDLPGLIAQVRAEGAQTVVFLSHLGLQLDRTVAATHKGLAAIVGGHTHVNLYTPEIVNGTPIVHAGAYGEYLGRLDLDLDDETGRTLELAGQLIPCDAHTPADGTISATLELVREEAERVASDG